ncbi:MAG: hypothetical protein QGF74_03430, partial [Candidatus Nanoarchaeia archaeon]|nr:hypothetical protein [Candidatus Nanoarchaeia archaeon]
MKKDFSLIKDYQKDVYLLSYIGRLLEWDTRTNMPKKGIKSRSEQISLISKTIHKKITSEKLYDSLKRLRNSKLDKINKLMINELYKDVDKSRRLPNEFIKKLSKTTTLTTLKWREARQQNNFKKFEPYLKKIVELKRQESRYIGLKGHPYNSLLDSYEEGMTTERLKPLFKKLRKSLVSLRKKVQGSKIHKEHKNEYDKDFNRDILKGFCSDVSKRMGLNNKNSYVHSATHPITFPVGINDIRITNNFDRHALFSFIAAIHESGHALYELNLPKKHRYTILYNATSIGAHESQSKFWESMIGKNKPFW